MKASPLDVIEEAVRVLDKHGVHMDAEGQLGAIRHAVKLLRSEPPTEAGEQGDVLGKAESWSKVFTLCRELGMLETDFPRTEEGVTGQGTVLDFIRFLASPPPSGEPTERVHEAPGTCSKGVSLTSDYRVHREHGCPEAIGEGFDPPERVSEASALREIADMEHADTCSYSLVRDLPCDCHVGVARRALEDTKGGR